LEEKPAFEHIGIPDPRTSKGDARASGSGGGGVPPEDLAAKVKAGRLKIAENAVDFEKALVALVDGIEANAKAIIDKTFIDLTAHVVDETPHNTGNARASWMVKIPTAEGEWKWELNSGTCEYMEALEAGHSKQRPNGMVASNLAGFADHIKKNLKRAAA